MIYYIAFNLLFGALAANLAISLDTPLGVFCIDYDTQVL